MVLAIRYTTNSLFRKYEKSNVIHDPPGRLALLLHSSILFPTSVTNEQDNMQVNNNIPAMTRNVTLQVVTFNRAWMMGLITISPPPDPMRTNPTAKERLAMKYLGMIVKTTKNIQQPPKPNTRPKEKYIVVRLGACDVTARAAVAIRPPLTATDRWLNRLQRAPTTGPNRLLLAHAKEPTQAIWREEKKRSIK